MRPTLLYHGIVEVLDTINFFAVSELHHVAREGEYCGANWLIGGFRGKVREFDCLRPNGLPRSATSKEN